MLEAVNIEYHHGSLESQLTEISQSRSIRFAFLEQIEEGKFQTFHPLVKCRDYLNDVLHFKAVEQSASIYGFDMTPEKNHIDLTRTRLLISFPETDWSALFIKNFGFLQKFEQENFEIEKAKLFAVQDQPKKIMLDADPFWQNCTQLVSLLTYLCRVSLYLDSPEENWMEKMKNQSGNDGKYFRAMEPWHPDVQFKFFPKLDFSKSPTPSGFPESSEVGVIHDWGGILSFISRGKQWPEHGYGEPEYISFEGYKLLKKDNDLVNQMRELSGI